MKNYLFMIFGVFSFAFSVAIFAMPNSLAEGGIPGLSLLLYFGLGWSPAVVTLIANVLVLSIGYRYLPKSMIIKSIVAIPLFSFFLFILEDTGSELNDPLLAAIYAGVLTGIGFGFIFLSGSTIGGTSTIAKVLNYKFGWELTGTNFVLDALVVLGGVFVIGPVMILYTVVALFIGKKVTDYVLEGFESKKVVHIFSDFSEEISFSLRRNLDAHTSILESKDDGSGKIEHMIYVAVPKQQLFYLKKLINEVDEEAFTVVHSAKDVSGGSFKKAHYPTQKVFNSNKEEKKYYKEKVEE